MIVTMAAGIGINDPKTLSVVEKARANGLNPVIKSDKGTNYSFTQIHLRDGSAKSSSVPEHLFRPMEGVENVQRVTPPRVSVYHNGNGEPHRIKLGQVKIGYGLPCRLVAGPCTVDPNIDDIVGRLSGLGIGKIRGGCFKPRSSPYSFSGYGEKGVSMLLEACKKHGVRTVFTEVIDSSHIDIVRTVRDDVGYKGQVVLWVGARTSNPFLMHALAGQTEFPVMLKNTIDAVGVDDLYERAEWLLAGNVRWKEDGTLDEKKSVGPINDRVILCLRGTRQHDRRSPYRFVPNHYWIDVMRQNCWAPIAVDPSHSAGTMVKDLVMRNLSEALRFGPDLVMVEGGYPAAGYNGFRGLCDKEQSVPIERMSEVIKMVKDANDRRFGQAVF